MKKRISFFISLLMIFCLTIAVSAANEVWVSSASGEPGDTVQVSVSLGEFYGIASLKLSLEYDVNNLTLTDIHYSDTMPGYFQLPQTFDNPSVMNWHDTKNISGNCDFATLTFRIHEDAPAGDYNIVLGVYLKESFGYGTDGSVIPYEWPDPKYGVITVEGETSDYVPVTKITLDTSSLTMEVGDRETIEATIYPSDATSSDVSWYSSDEDVATVDENGKVKAVGVGTATITARADNVSASCRVKVKAAHTHVYIETIPEGKFRASSATCTDKATYYYSCSCGKTSSDTFTYGTTLSHTFGEWKTVTEPTETSEGLAEAVCTSCKKAKETKVLPVIGHSHTYDQKVTLSQYIAAEATCEEKALYYYSCECGEAGTETFEAGNLANHTMIRHDAKDATCTAEGNKLYFECDVCDKLFTDYAGTTETTLATVTLSKVPHEYSDKWTWDKTNHWHKCNNCKAVTDIEAHIPGPEATETTDQTCTVCDYIITPAKDHEHDYGTEWKSDEDGHWTECNCGEKSSVTEHTDNDDDGECDTCGYAVEVPHEHDYGTAWEYDATGHWHKCTDETCDAISEVLPHNPGAVATEEKAQTCTDCGYVITPALDHTHKVDPDAEWKSDEDGHWHECSCGDEVDMAEHTESEWIVDKKATSKQNGERHKECTVCGYITVAESIPAIVDKNQIIMPKLFNVTVKTSEGGETNVSEKFLIAYGASRTIKITPDDGYEVADVTINGRSVGAVTKYNLRGADRNYTIEITFEKID